MPLLYRGTCRACGHQRGWVQGGLSLLDDAARPTLKNAATGGLPLPPLPGYAEPQAIVLPHPGEGRVAEGLGLPIEEAAAAGRLLGSQTRMCRACGTVLTPMELRVPVGCGLALFAALIGAAVAGSILWRATGHLLAGVPAALFAFFALLIATLWLVEQVGKYRHRRLRAALAATRRCPRCDGLSSVPIGSAKNVRCERCGERAVDPKVWGIS